MSDSMDDDGPDERVNLLEPGHWNEFTRYHFLLAKFLLFAGVAVIAFWILDQIGAVLFPVVVSLTLAYLFDPMIDWFGERGIGRTTGIMFVLAGGILSVTLFALVLYPTVVDQVSKVGQQLPKLVELLETRTLPWIEKTFDYKLPSSISEGVEQYGQSLGEYVPTLANRVGIWLGGVATSTGAVVAGLINLIMIPVFTFFFLRDFDRMRLKLIEFIPEHHRRVVLDRAAKMDQVVGHWVRGQLQVAGMLAILYAIGLSIAFALAGVNITSGISIGILSGLLNFVPYVGTAFGMILSFLIVLINWSGFGPVIAVAVVFVLVQSLEGYLITPKIVGDQVGLNPVTVIIVLLIGGEIYGLIGFIVAVPLFGALKVLLPDIIAWYKNTAFFTGTPSVPEPGDGSEMGHVRTDGGRHIREADSESSEDADDTDEGGGEETDDGG